MKIRCFFIFAMIALIGLTGCNIDPSAGKLKLDAPIQSEEDLLSRGYRTYIINSRVPNWPHTEVINSYIAPNRIKPNPYNQGIYVKLEARGSLDDPWVQVSTPGYIPLCFYSWFPPNGYVERSYSSNWCDAYTRFVVLAGNIGDFTYSFEYDDP